MRTACMRAHTRLDTRTATWENCYCRGGLAIRSTGIFPGGPINNGPMDGRFHSFIHSFIYLFAAPRHFSVDAVKNVRDWQKKSNWASVSVLGGQQQGQAAWWKEAGWSANRGMPREIVLQNDQGNGETNVRHHDSRDEEFATSVGWLNLFLCCNSFSWRRMPENSPRLVKFVTFSSWIFEKKELNAWPKLPPGPK